MRNHIRAQSRESLRGNDDTSPYKDEPKNQPVRVIKPNSRNSSQASRSRHGSQQSSHRQSSISSGPQSSRKDKELLKVGTSGTICFDDANQLSFGDFSPKFKKQKTKKSGKKKKKKEESTPKFQLREVITTGSLYIPGVETSRQS